MSLDQMLLCVASRVVESLNTVSFMLASPDGRQLPAWQPGAHIDMHLPNGLTRQYSLCGDLSESQFWKIAVALAPNSRGGSQFLHESLSCGDHILVDGPRNNFPLLDADEYIFIAGGIGITPFLSMIQKVVMRDKAWKLIYGGRSRAHMAFISCLAAWSPAKVDIVSEDEEGLIDLDAALSSLTPGTAVYCCGPEPLVSAVEQRSLYWSAGTLHTERFFTSASESYMGNGFVVEILSTGERIYVPADAVLLDVLECNGYEISSSCRAGICGTCVTRVIDGIPQHNDDVLSESERRSNKVILPCVSRAKTAVLVLDL